MIYKHLRTGVMYRKLIESFSVERQCHSVVYIRLKTGEVFDRDADKFGENFVFINDPQTEIEPRNLNQTEMKV